jgi:hypothetical protein
MKACPSRLQTALFRTTQIHDLYFLFTPTTSQLHYETQMTFTNFLSLHLHSTSITSRCSLLNLHAIPNGSQFQQAYLHTRTILTLHTYIPELLFMDYSDTAEEGTTFIRNVNNCLTDNMV